MIEGRFFAMPGDDLIDRIYPESARLQAQLPVRECAG